MFMSSFCASSNLKKIQRLVLHNLEEVHILDYMACRERNHSLSWQKCVLLGPSKKPMVFN